MRIIALLAFMMMLFGCNSENAALSPIKKTRIHAKIILPSGVSPSNMMLFGKSTDGSRIARVMNSLEESFILPSGSWTLYSIVWSGANLQGDVYCETVPAELQGPDLPVELVLTNNDCDQSHFRGSTTQVGAPLKNFGNVNIEWCEALGKINLSTDQCNDNLDNNFRREARGHAMSYRYSIKAYDFHKGKLSFHSDSIYTSCLSGLPPVGGILKGLADSFVSNLPIGDGSSTPFYISLEAYPGSTSCNPTSHGMRTVNFEHGIQKNSQATKYLVDGTAVHKLYLKMNSEEICQDSSLTQTFAGGDGSRGSPYLICNVKQFYNMYNSPTSSFKLLSDIDLSKYYLGKTALPNISTTLPCLEKGSNFYPLGYGDDCQPSNETFSGNDFDGGGKTIKGLRILMAGKDKVGLYMAKNSGEIRRLKISDAKIRGRSIVGVLAGRTGATFRDIMTNTTVVESSGDYVGGIAGSNAFASTCLFSNIRTEKNYVIATGSFVGGILGQSNSCDYSQISVSGFVSGGQSPTGGIAGNLTDGAMEKVSFDGFVRGLVNVGGLTGDFLNSSITTSYMNGIVVATTLGTGVRAGGLVGKATGGSLQNSYFFGHIEHTCSSNDNNCRISNIVGETDWSLASQTSNSYTNASVTNLSATGGGTQRDNAEFFDLSASWPAGFVTSAYDLPRLAHEVTVSSSFDLRHPCRSTPFSATSVANQISNGRGTPDKPVTLCTFGQLKDMQLNNMHTEKSYKLGSYILATENFAASTKTFSGTLDGDLHAIVSMRVEGNSGQQVSWWSAIGTSGSIKNLFLFNNEIDDPSSNASTTSMLATINYGLIDRVYSYYGITSPGTAGEHSFAVNTNYGTIANSQFTGTVFLNNDFAGVAYYNYGTIEDTRVSLYAYCFAAPNECFGATGMTIENTSIIRRNEIIMYLYDYSDDPISANFSFVTLFNSGLIEDIHIKESYIQSMNPVTHAVAVHNNPDGIIRRVYNEGRVRVAEYGLPNIAPTTQAHFTNSVSSVVGFSEGFIEKFKYRHEPRWTYPQGYGEPTRDDLGAECRYTTGAPLVGAWEATITAQYERFGIMGAYDDPPFKLTRAPDFTGAGDVYHSTKIGSCAAPAGSTVVYYVPIDILGGAGYTTLAQSLNWTTFSDWEDAVNISTNQDVIHNYLYGKEIGTNAYKPVWIFDNTNSIRLYR